MKKFARLLIVFVFLLGVLQATPAYGKRPGTLASTSAATLKDEWQEKLKAVQEERKTVREEMKVRVRSASEAAKLVREEFKSRLAEIKDAKKRLTLQRIDLNLGKVNEKWVEHWNKTLTRLSELLVKLESRTASIEEAGGDVTGVRLAIVVAEEAIAEAQDAINTQAGATYIIEIEDDDNLGGAASAVIQQLREDLKEVTDVVRLAHEAVKEVLQELKGLEITPI